MGINANTNRRMKKLIIIFCLAVTLNAGQILSSFDNLWMAQVDYAMEITNKEYEAPNISYLKRAACRLPKRHYTVEERWMVFWSKQKCGMCDLPAIPVAEGGCRWLVAQKSKIKERWTVTQSGQIEITK